jgi:hypothetical protein
MSISDENTSSFDSPSPPSLSIPPSPLLDQPEKENENEIEIEKALFADSEPEYCEFEYWEMSERYIDMNVVQDCPSVQDIDLMKVCMEFWLKETTFEGWRNSSQLYEQLLLSLKQQDHEVRQRWYKTKHVSVPAMTFLLNRIVDQWRIFTSNEKQKQKQRHKGSKSWNSMTVSHQNSVFHGSTPSQMLNQLLTWKSMEPMLLLEARSYNLIMQAAMGDYRGEETAMLCESIFRRMLPTQTRTQKQSSSYVPVDRRTLPDSYTCMFVLQAWARRCTTNPDATERMWHLFSEMQQLHKDGILEAPLNAIHYNVVIDGLMRSNQVDWMNRAEQLFQQMNESPTLIPTRSTYGSYLDGWLSYKHVSLEQWHRCKVVLDDALERSKAMPEEPLVNASTFAHFMRAANWLGRYDLAEQTYVDLCGWHKQLPTPSMAPDNHCMRALVHVYSYTRRPDQAEQALLAVVKEARGKNRLSWWPGAFHFEMVIQCWLKQRTSEEDGLERAGQLLLRAAEVGEELRLNLSDDSLYWIVSAWAKSGRDDAPVRAAALLDAFRSRSKASVRKACFELVEKMQSPSIQQQRKTTGSTT